MLARQSRLRAVLNNELDELKSFVEKYQTSLTSAVVDNKLYESLKKDETSITEVDEESLNKIIDLFDLVENTKKNLKNTISIIRNIFLMNKEENTTITLEESQKESLNTFIEHLQIVNKVREKTIPIEEPEYEKSKSRIKEIENLISDLEDKNNTKMISNISLIKEILNKSNLEEKEKRKIIISLMKYNQEIFLETKKDTLIEEYFGESLNEEELKEVFKKYNYDYSLFNDQVKDSIRRYGEIKNISEVLDCLNGFKYPKLDEKIYGNTIFSLVVGSTFETINNCTINATNKGFTPSDLLEIPSALVRQKKTKVIYRKLKNSDENTVSIDLEKIENDPNFINENEIAFDLLNGSSVDFITNIEYLEDNGFDIMYIFQKCKQLLVLDSNKLITNLSLFEKYGLPLDCSRDRLTNQTFSALLSNNLADQFIEIHPLGYKYIRDNMSCLKEYKSPLDIVFYNIYESQKPFIAANGKPMLANAFKEIKSGERTIIQLCDEITRKCNKYKTIPYRNIKEDNKIEKTDTFIPTFKNEEEYETIIKNNYTDINDEIFENNYIKAIDKYTDIKNPLIYNFDGTRISKLKVLRIFGLLIEKGVKPNLESLMYSVTYKSILDERSYTKLNNIISKEIEED